MSQVIDRKIVDMEFNNSRFEGNVKSTISLLDKLKEKLNFSGAEKSFSNVEKSANGIKMDGLRYSVDTVASKFSAFEVMAVTALANITNSAVNAGKQLVRSLSIDQITAGWSKYGEKTSAVQTIMAATKKQYEDWLKFTDIFREAGDNISEGFKQLNENSQIQVTAGQFDLLKKRADEFSISIEDVFERMNQFSESGSQMQYVNDQMEKLNWFTDETSYSFLDMVNNIGKFTSNNVDLNTAVTAMQGISTWAAISGANVEQAGRAMYNLSQAIAVGSVKLMDWRSIENANMSTTEFKQTVIDTAIELNQLQKSSDGTIKTIKGTEVTIESFNQALSEGWFTSEVLLKTLNKYGGFTDKLYEISEATGLTATRLLQNIEEFQNGTLDIQEVALETGMSAEDLSKAFSELSKDTYDLGKRAFRAAQEAKTFEEAIAATKDAVSTGWMNTFEIIFGDYEKAKVLWTDVANNLYDVFAAGAEDRNSLLKAALYTEDWEELDSTIEDTAFSLDIFSLKTKKLADSLNYTDDNLLKIVAPLKEIDDGFLKLSGRDLLVQSIQNAFDALLNVIELVKDAWHDIFPAITAERIYRFTQKLEKFTRGLILTEEKSEKLKNTLRGFFALLDIGKYYISTIVKGISDLLKYIFNVDKAFDFGDKFGNFVLNLRDSIKEGDSFGRVIQKIVEKLKIFVDYTKDTIKGNTILGKIIQNVIERIKTFILYIKESIKGNTEFGKVVGKTILSIKTVISKFREFLNLVKERVDIPKFSIIGILEGTFSVVGKVVNFIIGVTKKIIPLIKKVGAVIFKVVKNFAETVKKVFKDSGINSIFDLLKGGILTGILLRIFQSVTSFKNIAEGFSGLGDSIGKIFTSLESSIKSFQEQTKAKALKDIAISIGILAASLLVLSSIEPSKLTTSIMALTALFGELIGFMKITDASSFTRANFKSMSKGLITFSAGILILSFAMKNFAELSWEGVAKGVVAMGALFGMLLGVARILSSKTNSVFSVFDKKPLKKIASGLIVIAAAMVIFAIAMKKFGSLEWEQIGKGIAAIGSIMAIMIISSRLMGKGMLGSAAGIAVISGSLLILFAAFKLFSTLDWGDLAKGLTAIAGSMLILSLALNSMKGTFGAAVGMAIVSSALLIFVGVMKLLAKMSIEDLVKSLLSIGVLLIGLAMAFKLMDPGQIFKSSAALLVAAVALKAMASVLKAFGQLSIPELLKGFVALAGIFAIVGIAAKLLDPITKSITALGLSLLAVGAGLSVVGLGLILIGTGIKILIEAISGGIEGLVKAILSAIEEIVTFIPRLVVILAEFVGTFIVELAKILREYAPELIDALFSFVVSTLKTMAERVPEMVVYIMDFIIGIIDAIAEKTPEIIKSLVNLLMSIFQGFVEAMKEIDPKVLEEGLEAVGLFATLLAVLAGLGLLAGAAMIGVVAFGLVIGELALVLAALGALFSDKKIVDYVRDSKYILEAVGEAFGALLGGFMSGFSDELPDVATNLSLFMTNLRPFIDGLKLFDDELLAKAAILPGIIIAITAAEVVNAISSWLVGDKSMEKFGNDMVALGSALKRYSEEVAGIDSSSVTASANAAMTLAEFARKIPNEGGLIADIVGDNNLGTFAAMLPEVGKNLAAYGDAVKDISPEKVTASANAAMSIADFARNLPNEGGLLAKIVGDNTIGTFAAMLPEVGKNLAEYGKAVEDITPDKVTASASAAMSIAEFAKNLPNQGGLIADIVGDNTIGTFAAMLPSLGKNLAEYGRAVEDITPEKVTASANAAMTLAELANNIPETGGWIDVLLGDSSIATFSKQLPSFGEAMSNYSDSVSDLDVDRVLVSAQAAKEIVDIAKTIKESKIMEESSGFKSDFAAFSGKIEAFGKGLAKYSASISGDKLDLEAMDRASSAAEKIVNVVKFIPETGGFFKEHVDLKKFGNSLSSFGDGLVEYSKSISGENKLDLDAMASSVEAAKSLVDLSNTLEPISGFFTKLFSGSSDLATFGKTLPAFGNGLKEYCTAISSDEFVMDPDKVSTSVQIAKNLSEIYDHLEPINGIVGFFAGKSDLATFGKTLPVFGNGLKEYCMAISSDEFKMDSKKVSDSVAIAKDIAGLYDVLDKMGGVVGFFSGQKDLSAFGEMLPSFAEGIVGYCAKISEDGVVIDKERIDESLLAADTLVQVGKIAGEVKDFGKIKKFGENLPGLASAINTYFASIAGIYAEGGYTGIAESVNDAKLIVELMTETQALGKDCTKNFVEGLSKLGVDGVTEFEKAFKDGESRVKTAAENMVKNSISGINALYSRFYDAGKDSALGFVNGLRDKLSLALAESAGRQIGASALSGTKSALDSHSPSKEYEKLGLFCPKGLYNGVVKNMEYSELAGEEIGKHALTATKKILSRISTYVGGEIELDPVIRPVLDISAIKSGSSRINAMLSTNKAYSISARINGNAAYESGIGGEGSVNNYWSMTQNNYSPKALSASDIYRQTKNQFSALKRKVTQYDTQL